MKFLVPITAVVMLATILAIFAHGSVPRIWVALIGAAAILGGASWLIGPHSAP